MTDERLADLIERNEAPHRTYPNPRTVWIHHDGGQTGALEMMLDLRDARADVARLTRERDRARATSAKLNRRCQSAEAGLAARLESGRSFGRVLANSAAEMYREQADALRRDVGLLREAREAAALVRADELLRGLVDDLDRWNVDMSKIIARPVDYHWPALEAARMYLAARALALPPHGAGA